MLSFPKGKQKRTDLEVATSQWGSCRNASLLVPLEGQPTALVGSNLQEWYSRETRPRILMVTELDTLSGRKTEAYEPCANDKPAGET